MRGKIKKLTEMLKVIKSTKVRYLEEKVSEDILSYFEEGTKNETFVSVDSGCPSTLLGRGIIVICKEQSNKSK